PLKQTDVPPGIAELVTKCTAKKPAERPQGFAPVCAELEKIQAGLEPSAPVTEPPGRPAWLIPTAALVFLLIAGLMMWVLLRKPKETGPAFAKTLSTSTGEMELVSAGPFLFGQKKESVILPSFYVDKTEVTNQAYAGFAKATGRAVPEGFPQDKPDLPVVNVSILDAQAFAAWAGKRLPNAREWEKAARGIDGRAFPWGNEKDPSRANVGSAGLKPVTDFSNGASPSGAVNMVGNAWELVEQLTPPS